MIFLYCSSDTVPVECISFPVSDVQSSKTRLTEHQSGNRKMHSNGNTKYISDMFLDAMDRKQVTALGLLDLSKAFDSLEHALLLAKLRSLGLSEASQSWFRSYLTDRRQSVCNGCDLSEPRKINTWCTPGFNPRTGVLADFVPPWILSPRTKSASGYCPPDNIR